MLLEPRDKWFINTCNTHIPNEIISLLQLGEGFYLLLENKTDLIIEYIKHVENNFSRFKQQQACVSSMRNQFFNFLKLLDNLDHCRTDIDLKILDAVLLTKKFIKDNPDILFTRADKGNTVVTLDRVDYLNKMEAYLSDSDTYIHWKHNPVKKLLSDFVKTLVKS